MGESRTLRDPIHRFITLNEQEAALIDAPVFQRLRRLRQLACAYLVYPSAIHTRFEHSIGVCHVARLLGERLSLNQDEQKLVRLAALLHDLGHGPFSHISEEALELYSDHSKLPGKTDKIHEAITAMLIEQDPVIAHNLAANEGKKIINLLSSGYGEPIVKQILSGPLDADKQDYLLRDSYFCGVQYGVFDLPQLHEVLCRVQDKSGDYHLMVKKDGIHTLEQFVLAKYYITTQVYRHRIRLITDQMLIRAVTLGIEKDDIQELRELYSYDGTYNFVQRYTAWHDVRLLTTFSGHQFHGKISHSLFDGLMNRRLLKLVFKEDIKTFKAEARQVLSTIGKPKNRALRSRIESAVADELSQHCSYQRSYSVGDPGDLVVAHAYTFKNVKEQSRNDEASILIDGALPRQFENESTLFASIDGKLSETSFEIYAPVEYSTPAERRSLQQKLRTPIIQSIESLAAGAHDATV